MGASGLKVNLVGLLSFKSWNVQIRSLFPDHPSKQRVFCWHLYETRTPSFSWNQRSSIALLVSSPVRCNNTTEECFLVEQVPVDDYEIPIGKAEVLASGSDLTILTYGTPIYHCETALSLLRSPPPSLTRHIPESARSASVELIDLRTILPWDVDTVQKSVEKTGRLLIIHEASRTAGVGAEIAAEIQKRCFLKLEAPVRRLTSWE